jgi:dihydroorotase/N-acyl-D-amino-acid deacylase
MPSSFADRDEVVRLCQRLTAHDGIYATHMRDYKFKILEALDEALSVARLANVPVQVSHMQVVGKKNWAKLDGALDLIEKNLKSGVDVAMDAYPYLAGCCSLIQFLPDWCQSGGVPRLLERLGSPATRSSIASETDAYMSNSWDDLVISEVRTLANQSKIGKSIAKIAAEQGRQPELTAVDLLREEEGNVHVISFNSNEENLRTILTHPLTSVVTDGFVMEGTSHPRTFGTYPKFLGEYVRNKRWLTIEEAVRKTSTLPAQRFRLRDRGSLKPGSFADVTIFSGDRIGSDADYSNPKRDPQGIYHVLVNGQFGVRDGRLTDQLAGRCLPRYG